MCVRQARQTLRPSSGDDIVDAFLESAPTCASIPYVLTQLYDCLAGEADAISGLYGPLALRGYDTEVAPGNEGELPPVCSISRAQIDQDRLMADILTDQSEALLDEFGLVSGCRKEWETWLDDASVNADGLEESIDGVIQIMQSQVSPAGAREVEIRGIVDGIESQLKNIRNVIFASTLICPPKQ